MLSAVKGHHFESADASAHSQNFPARQDICPTNWPTPALRNRLTGRGWTLIYNLNQPCGV